MGVRTKPTPLRKLPAVLPTSSPLRVGGPVWPRRPGPPTRREETTSPTSSSALPTRPRRCQQLLGAFARALARNFWQASDRDRRPAHGKPSRLERNRLLLSKGSGPMPEDHAIIPVAHQGVVQGWISSLDRADQLRTTHDQCSQSTRAPEGDDLGTGRIPRVTQTRRYAWIVPRHATDLVSKRVYGYKTRCIKELRLGYRRCRVPSSSRYLHG